MDDFASRVDNFQVNKKVIEALNFAGALDCLGKTRLAIIQNIENILETMKKIATVKKEAANSLFGEDETTEGIVVEFVENSAEYPTKELLKLELDKIMVHRFGDPLEVAKLVKFLVSNDANYIKNTIIRIDGGQYGSC